MRTNVRCAACFFSLALILGLSPPSAALAQGQNWKISGNSITELKRSAATPLPAAKFHFTPSAAQAAATAPPLMPSVYCFDELAFFCRVEVRLEKKLRFPVKFRLGDVPYVDWMEGKRRTY